MGTVNPQFWLTDVNDNRAIVYYAGIIVLLAGVLRVWFILSIDGCRLDPDTLGYRDFAGVFGWFGERGFYSGSFSIREPLWIVFLYFWTGLFGGSDLSIRLSSCLLSVCLIPVFGLLLSKFTRNVYLLVLGMCLLAFHPRVVFEASRGLRTEAMTLFFLVFLLMSLRERGFSPVLFGVFAGLWALLRSPALGICFGLWAIFWVAGRFTSLKVPKGYTLPKVVLAVIIAAAVFIPHLYGQYRNYGSWQFQGNTYARWNANVEFQDKLGTEGFPTKKEWETNTYTGPPITYWQYMFDMHSLGEIVARQLRGWIEIAGYQALTWGLPRYHTAFEYNLLGLIFGAIFGVGAMLGWFKTLFDRKTWWVSLVYLLGTYYSAFLVAVRCAEPFRHTMLTYPVMVLVLIGGLSRTRVFQRVGSE